MNNINEKNTAANVAGKVAGLAGGVVGAGFGATFGHPMMGAAVGAVTAGAAAHKLVSTIFPEKHKTKIKEGIMSFKTFADEIDFGFTEEEFTVTGDEVYEDWGETEHLEEAEKNGRHVKLGKPFLTPGGPKKRSVYVKSPESGNVVKVNFGDPNMTIKKNIPARRRSFRARHNCSDPGPRHKARYWSCKQW